MNTLVILMSMLFSFKQEMDESLIFLENGSKIVQRESDSTITHVGIILKRDNDYFVYEADKPEVKKTLLEDYINKIDDYNKRKNEKRKLSVWIKYTNTKLPSDKRIQLENYLEKQIGRKYSIQSYVYGLPATGIHCSEYIGNSLNIVYPDLIENPCVNTPIDIWEKSNVFYKHSEKIK